MSAILIDPHGDDAALFAAYLCLKHKPLVVVTHRAIAVSEISEAMDVLGCRWAERSLDDLSSWAPQDELFITPSWEQEGLPEHNLVADAVAGEYPDIRYVTYAGHPRKKTRTDHESEFRPPWIWRKLRALACYESQAHTPAHQHFIEDMREYVRP